MTGRRSKTLTVELWGQTLEHVRIHALRFNITEERAVAMVLEAHFTDPTNKRPDTLRNRVEVALAFAPDMSNAEIGRRLHASATYIGSIRKQISTRKATP